jgi:hypothetical protein
MQLRSLDEAVEDVKTGLDSGKTVYISGRYIREFWHEIKDHIPKTEGLNIISIVTEQKHAGGVMYEATNCPADLKVLLGSERRIILDPAQKLLADVKGALPLFYIIDPESHMKNDS